MEYNNTFNIKQLIINKLSRNVNTKEQQKLEDWVNHSPANVKLLKHLQSKTFLADIIQTDDSLLIAEQWQQLKRRTIRRKQIRLYKRYAVGAAILIPALIFGSLLLEYKKSDHITADHTDGKALVYWADGSTTVAYTTAPNSEKNEQDTITIKPIEGVVKTPFNRIVIPRGAEYIVKLTDGSTIHLNAESELEIPIQFSDTNRNIRLKGGAYFNIANNATSPFIIKIKNTEIKVLGTRFDVRAYDDQTNILTTLIQGKVCINSTSSQVILQPGMQASVESNGSISVQKVSTDRYTAWTDGRFVFENETVEQIMQEAARWYDFQYTIDDPDISNMRLTMNIIRNQEFSEFIKMIEKIEKIKFKINGRIVKITKNKTNIPIY